MYLHAPALTAFLLSGAVGCVNVYPPEFGTGGKAHDGEGSYIGEGGDDTADTDCEEFGEPEGPHFDGHDLEPVYDAGAGTCTWGLELTPQDGDQFIVTGVTAFGYDSAVLAPDQETAKFGREDSQCNHFANTPSLVAASTALGGEECVEVGAATEEELQWAARTTRDPMAAGDYIHDLCINDCNNSLSECFTPCTYSAPSCAGTYFLEQSFAASCSEYGAVGIDIQGNPGRILVSGSAAADASAGSGDFLLLPTALGDYDDDGLYNVRYVPVQLNGTGRPGANAVISAITSVTIPSGATLRRLNDGASTFTWLHDDTLVDPTGISHPITGAITYSSPKPLGPGVFLASGVSADDIDEFRVSMSWTVGTNNGPALPQGWSFTLADIGCSNYVQAFTIRRLTSPERVTIEPYGVPRERVVLPATAQSWGTEFDFTYRNLHMEAELRSMSIQGATLVLQTLAYDGTDVCSTGTYSLVAE
jgi:hypothetical protein